MLYEHVRLKCYTDEFFSIFDWQGQTVGHNDGLVGIPEWPTLISSRKLQGGK